MPVTHPALSDVNLTPRFTAFESFAEATDGCAVAGQIEQGHWPGGGGAGAVMKLQVYGLAIRVPGTATLPGPVRVKPIVLACTGLLNVNEIAVPVDTLVWPFSGVVDVTVG